MTKIRNNILSGGQDRPLRKQGGPFALRCKTILSWGLVLSDDRSMCVRSHRHHRPKPLSFNATLEAMRHHHSTVTLLTHRSPPPTTVRRRHRPARFRRRPIEASVTVIIRGRGWTVLNTQGGLWVQTKTAHHDPWHPRCLATQVVLTRPRLSLFAPHFARPSILVKNSTAIWTQD